MTNMLSRTADSLFWLNRYMERTDSMLRLLSIHYILSLDKGVNAPKSWRPVLEMTTYMNGDEMGEIENNTAAVLNKIILQTENMNSLKIIVHRARENARGVQDHITKETWEEVNQVYHYINHPELKTKLTSNEALEVIENLAQHSVLFAGIIELTMPRGTGWNFMSLGKYIERCFYTIHVLQNQLKMIEYDIEKPADVLQWRYLLLALSGYELHLKTYTGNNHNQNLLHQVISNENFTRSILYSLSRINIYLKKVTGSADENKESKSLTNALGKLYSSVKYKEPESLTSQSLQPFLEELQKDLSLFSTQLAQHFFLITNSAGSMSVFTIHHITRYEYNRPVKESNNEIKIYPYRYPGQEVLNHELIITNQPSVQTFFDYWGNKTGVFSLLQPHMMLVIESKLVVRTLGANEVSINRNGTFGELQHEMDDNLQLLELATPDFINNENAIDNIIQQIHFSTNTVAQTVEQCAAYIFENFKYVKGITNTLTTVNEILEIGAGVCQDFAHVMLQILRTLNIPGRYVSGYICPNKNGMRGEGATHAWVEAYLPGYGWAGIDPTNNVWVTNRHVKLAVGRHFKDCSPVKGTFKGIAKQKLSVYVSVSYEDGQTYEDLNNVPMNKQTSDDAEDEMMESFAAQQQQ